MNRFKKYLIFLLLFIPVFQLAPPVKNVNAEDNYLRMPPSRIYWQFFSTSDLGYTYYYERTEVQTRYAGYLQRSRVFNELGNVVYKYSGYLYPKGGPMPIPSKIKDNFLE